jgi:hypothetical protein
VVPAFSNLAVWHVFGEIVIDALLRDLDPAGLLAGHNGVFFSTKTRSS